MTHTTLYRAVRLVRERNWGVLRETEDACDLVSTHKTRDEARVEAKRLNNGGESGEGIGKTGTGNAEDRADDGGVRSGDSGDSEPSGEGC